jgi:hypothetical protein
VAWLTVKEALDLLKSEGVSVSDHMIRRWLREGKLKGKRPKNRKEGWRVDQKHLIQFIQSKKSQDSQTSTIHIYEAYEVLKKERDTLLAENEQLKAELEYLRKELSDKGINKIKKQEPEIDDHYLFDLSLLYAKSEDHGGVPVEIMQDEGDEEEFDEAPLVEKEKISREKVMKIWQEQIKRLNDREEVLKRAKEVLFTTLFKEDDRYATIEQTEKGYYICPFRSPRGKYYGSALKLIETAIPVLIKYANIQYGRELERQKLGY